jgi:hypothetical protein
MPIAGNYTYAVAISKSDTANFLPVGTQTFCDAIFVGGAGIVVAVLPDGSAVNFTCVAGEILPITAIRVNSTTTTATLMVALYYL